VHGSSSQNAAHIAAGLTRSRAGSDAQHVSPCYSRSAASVSHLGSITPRICTADQTREPSDRKAKLRRHKRTAGSHTTLLSARFSRGLARGKPMVPNRGHVQYQARRVVQGTCRCSCVLNRRVGPIDLVLHDSPESLWMPVYVYRVMSPENCLIKCALRCQSARSKFFDTSLSFTTWFPKNPSMILPCCILPCCILPCWILCMATR